MHAELFEDLTKKIAALTPVRPVGRVAAADGGKVQVTGLTRLASLGDLVTIHLPERGVIAGEVVQIEGGQVTVLPDGSLEGLSLGARVVLRDPLSVSPSDAWLGRIIDANGAPIDGRPLRSGAHPRPLRSAPPMATKRRGFGARLATGSHALNTVLPLVRGQRIGLFAGSGVGKTSLLGTLVQHVECDVAVIALIGERGREVGHFTRDVLGREGMRKSIVVAATSDQSALERRRCAWTAMSVAEHFRNQGRSVFFIADSITRFAEAHREITSAAGEVPVLRGHPPSTSQMITELCERSGPGMDGQGDITAVFSVLVQGSDMDEPVADMLRGVLDGHIVLDRTIAERGRYPAINLLRSVSRCLPDAASKDENEIIAKVRYMVSLYEQNAMMIRSGLYSEGNDPDLDMAVKLWHDIDQFLGQCGPAAPRDSFDKLRMILRRAGKR